MFFRCCSSFSEWFAGELGDRYPAYFGQRLKKDEELNKKGGKKKSLKPEKIKTYRSEIREHKKYWNTILWCMSEGGGSSRKELMMEDALEFYGIMEVHQDIIDKRIRDIDKRRKKTERKSR